MNVWLQLRLHLCDESRGLFLNRSNAPPQSFILLLELLILHVCDTAPCCTFAIAAGHAGQMAGLQYLIAALQLGALCT